MTVVSVTEHPLQGKRVLVTGATGFIGGRLAERLAKEQGAIVTGAGRRLERAAYLEQAGVTLLHLDMADLDSLPQAVSGQDVIFHLAVAPGSADLDYVHRINVLATEALVCQAAKAGVGRFVLVSSVAAYGPPDRPVMDEEHPLAVGQEALYGRTKAQGETGAMMLAKIIGLELAVIRPGLVYGPRSRTWSLGLLRLVQRRFPTLVGGGHGHASPVYIDNLVDGMILAASQPQAAGEDFQFVDQALPWRDFFGYYGRMAGRRLYGVPTWLAQGALALFRRFSGRSETNEAMLAFLTNRSVYPYAKAERLLGYQPTVDIEEGMWRTERWLREAGHLPAPGR
jgi:nucleoside-diphosphate-sugar epimerase